MCGENIHIVPSFASSPKQRLFTWYDSVCPFCLGHHSTVGVKIITVNVVGLFVHDFSLFLFWEVALGLSLQSVEDWF